MKIIRRCELPASLLENVAEAPWGFNGMNVKGDFAVDGGKDTRKSRLGIPKTTMRLAKHVLRWCRARKAACRCLSQALVAHANKQGLLKKNKWHIPNSNVPPRNCCIVQAVVRRAVNKPHLILQCARSQRLSKNDNHPAVRVASFFTGKCCQSAMGLQWHERQSRLRSGRCGKTPEKVDN